MSHIAYGTCPHMNAGYIGDLLDTNEDYFLRHRLGSPSLGKHTVLRELLKKLTPGARERIKSQIMILNLAMMLFRRKWKQATAKGRIDMLGSVYDYVKEQILNFKAGKLKELAQAELSTTAGGSTPPRDKEDTQRGTYEEWQKSEWHLDPDWEPSTDDEGDHNNIKGHRQGLVPRTGIRKHIPLPAEFSDPEEDALLVAEIAAEKLARAGRRAIPSGYTKETWLIEMESREEAKAKAQKSAQEAREAARRERAEVAKAQEASLNPLIDKFMTDISPPGEAISQKQIATLTAELVTALAELMKVSGRDWEEPGFQDGESFESSALHDGIGVGNVAKVERRGARRKENARNLKERKEREKIEKQMADKGKLRKDMEQNQKVQKEKERIEKARKEKEQNEEEVAEMEKKRSQRERKKSLSKEIADKEKARKEKEEEQKKQNEEEMAEMEKKRSQRERKKSLSKEIAEKEKARKEKEEEQKKQNEEEMAEMEKKRNQRERKKSLSKEIADKEKARKEKEQNQKVQKEKEKIEKDKVRNAKQKAEQERRIEEEMAEREKVRKEKEQNQKERKEKERNEKNKARNEKQQAEQKKRLQKEMADKEKARQEKEQNQKEQKEQEIAEIEKKRNQREQKRKLGKEMAENEKAKKQKEQKQQELAEIEKKQNQREQKKRLAKEMAEEEMAAKEKARKEKARKEHERKPKPKDTDTSDESEHESGTNDSNTSGRDSPDNLEICYDNARCERSPVKQTYISRWLWHPKCGRGHKLADDKLKSAGALPNQQPPIKGWRLDRRIICPLCGRQVSTLGATRMLDHMVERHHVTESLLCNFFINKNTHEPIAEQIKAYANGVAKTAQIFTKPRNAFTDGIIRLHDTFKKNPAYQQRDLVLRQRTPLPPASTGDGEYDDVQDSNDESASIGTRAGRGRGGRRGVRAGNRGRGGKPKRLKVAVPKAKFLGVVPYSSGPIGGYDPPNSFTLPGPLIHHNHHKTPVSYATVSTGTYNTVAPRNWMLYPPISPEYVEERTDDESSMVVTTKRPHELMRELTIGDRNTLLEVDNEVAQCKGIHYAHHSWELPRYACQSRRIMHPLEDQLEFCRLQKGILRSEIDQALHPTKDGNKRRRIQANLFGPRMSAFDELPPGIIDTMNLKGQWACVPDIIHQVGDMDAYWKNKGFKVPGAGIVHPVMRLIEVKKEYPTPIFSWTQKNGQMDYSWVDPEVLLDCENTCKLPREAKALVDTWRKQKGRENKIA